MSIELFDVQSGFGGRIPGEPDSIHVEHILDEMHRVDISYALVRTVPERFDIDFSLSNDTLYHACLGNDALIPCPVIVPNSAYDVEPEAKQVDDAIRHRSGAMVIRPGYEHWNFQESVSGNLFNAMQERRMPVYCSAGQVTIHDLFQLAARYSELPLIYTDISYRDLRLLLPLLQNHDNVFVSTGPAFSIHLGIEFLVQHVGAERLLFGTGLPASAPMAAIAQLMYAKISDEEKALIGAGNLLNVIRGISR